MGAFAGAVDRAKPSRVEHLTRVIRSDLREMPGMRLTRLQFRRLWSLGEAGSDAIVANLLRCDYLAESPDGRLCRRADLM